VVLNQCTQDNVASSRSSTLRQGPSRVDAAPGAVAAGAFGLVEADQALGLIATLECELFDQQPGGRFATRREAKLAVFDYLETFYNPRRRHSALGHLAPATFEARHTLTTAA
jgi:transposase InsO family protein